MSVSVPLLRTHQIIPFIALTAYTGEEGHSQPRETRLGTLGRLLQILNMSTRRSGPDPGRNESSLSFVMTATILNHIYRGCPVNHVSYLWMLNCCHSCTSNLWLPYVSHTQPYYTDSSFGEHTLAAVVCSRQLHKESQVTCPTPTDKAVDLWIPHVFIEYPE